MKAILQPRDTSGCPDGSGTSCGTSQVTENQGDFRVKLPGDPKFTHYAFNFTVPISQGASHLVFEIEDNGKTVMETNGGGGFPVNTLLFPAIRDGSLGKPPWTCRTSDALNPPQPGIVNQTLHVKAAVSSSRAFGGLGSKSADSLVTGMG